MSRDAVCEICGHVGDDVRVRLAWFREPRFGPVASIPRCLDHDACRQRCAANGDEWPLEVRDQSPAFVLPVPVSAEPEPKMSEEETTSWFR